MTEVSMVEPHDRARGFAPAKPPPKARLLTIARRHARRAGLKGEDAEDCVAACRAHLWLRRREAPPGTVISAWLDRVAANFTRDFRRSLHRRDRHTVPWPSADPGGLDASDMAAPSPPTDSGLLLEWFWTEIKAALDRLPAGQRELFVRHHLKGEPLDVLAASLGRRCGAVAQELYRARHSLRRDLERHGTTETDLYEAIRAFTGAQAEEAPRSAVDAAKERASKRAPERESQPGSENHP